jgi:hypothetical protein
LFRIVDSVAIDAWSDIKMPKIMDYFAALNQVYKNVFPIFLPEENKTIREFFREFWDIVLSLNMKENQNVKTYYRLLVLLDKINAHIVAYMQKRRYFFRTERGQAKGIDAALKYFAKREES